MKMRFARTCAFAAISIALVPRPARAQAFDGFAAQMAMISMHNSVLQRSSANRNQGNATVLSRQLSPIDGAILTYNRQTARTRRNLAKFVEETRATDPAGAAKMQALFASTDIIGMIDQKMQQTYGMRANNVADAYAVWWVSAWMGSKGRSDDATPGQMAMVKRQATNALASTPEFAAATDAGKQELAEALLVQAALIGDTIDTYTSDPSMLAKARAAIAKGASGMGLDLSKMTLTDQGFVPFRKTGAANPEPGTPEQALAANAVTTAPAAANDTSPPYVLFAAAGGAGLGGVFLLGKMMGRRV